jgi:hypothetical protein
MLSSGRLGRVRALAPAAPTYSFPCSYPPRARPHLAASSQAQLGTHTPSRSESNLEVHLKINKCEIKSEL